MKQVFEQQTGIQLSFRYEFNGTVANEDNGVFGSETAASP